jgi:hypothetical protein
MSAKQSVSDRITADVATLIGRVNIASTLCIPLWETAKRDILILPRSDRLVQLCYISTIPASYNTRPRNIYIRPLTMLLRQLLLILLNARVLVQVLRQSQQNRLCRYGQVVIGVMVLVLDHYFETSLLESRRKRVHPTACVLVTHW